MNQLIEVNQLTNLLKILNNEDDKSKGVTNVVALGLFGLIKYILQE